MRTKKFIVALCFSFFMFMCSVSTVYAYNTYNQHKLTYGVGNYGKDTQHYFITSSASSYASYINTAMSEWVNTTSSMGVTTPISYTKTTTQSSSRMDIYQVSTVNEWWGLTTMYNGSTEVDPFSSNWAWGKIQLDADFSDLSENKRLAVIAHEMGHVMGLAHSDFSNVLMRADIAYYSSSTSRAQTNDLGGIYYLYNLVRGPLPYRYVGAFDDRQVYRHHNSRSGASQNSHKLFALLPQGGRRARHRGARRIPHTSV